MTLPCFLSAGMSVILQRLWLTVPESDCTLKLLTKDDRPEERLVREPCTESRERSNDLREALRVLRMSLRMP